MPPPSTIPATAIPHPTTPAQLQAAPTQLATAQSPTLFHFGSIPPSPQTPGAALSSASGLLSNSEPPERTPCATSTEPTAAGQENLPPAPPVQSTSKGKGKTLSKHPSAATIAKAATVDTADLLKDIKDDASANNTIILTAMSKLTSSLDDVRGDVKAVLIALATTSARVSKLEKIVQEHKSVLDDYAHSSTTASLDQEKRHAEELNSIQAVLSDTRRKVTHLEATLGDASAAIPDLRERMDALENGSQPPDSESSASTSADSASDTGLPNFIPDIRPRKPSPDIIEIDDDEDDDGDDEDDANWEEVPDSASPVTRSRGRSHSIAEQSPTSQARRRQSVTSKSTKRSKSTGGVPRNATRRGYSISPSPNRPRQAKADTSLSLRAASKRKSTDVAKRSPPKRHRSTLQPLPDRRLNLTSTSAYTAQPEPHPVPDTHLNPVLAAPYQPPVPHPTLSSILHAAGTHSHTTATLPTHPPSHPAPLDTEVSLEDIKKYKWLTLRMRSTVHEAWSRDKASNHEVLRNINVRLVNDGQRPILPNPYANRLIDGFDTLWDFRSDMDTWLFAGGWAGRPEWLHTFVLLPPPPPAPVPASEPLADVFAMSHSFASSSTSRGGRGGGRGRGSRGAYYGASTRGYAHM